jgi:hypothetical protein
METFLQCLRCHRLLEKDVAVPIRVLRYRGDMLSLVKRTVLICPTCRDTAVKLSDEFRIQHETEI